MADAPVNAQAPDKNKLRSSGGSIKLKYPLDLEENYPHSVDFTIYIPQKSSFNKTVSKLPTNNVSNYEELGNFTNVATGAQVVYLAQAGFQVAKDSALGAATFSSAVGGGGPSLPGKLLSLAGKLAAGTAGAAFGAVASVATNSKTQAYAKGAIATELIKQQNEVTGLRIERTAQRIDKMISLYMPANFFTTYGHDYDQISVKEAGGMLGMIGGAAGSLGINNLADLSSKIQNPQQFLQQLQQLPGSQNPYVALATGALGSSTSTPLLGGSLVGSGYADVKLFQMGYAQNPMLEVIYRGTNFRSFQFEFMFQPKNQKEANEVLEIIKTFKFHGAPETNPMINPNDGTAQGGTSMPMFFVPPSEFGITLRHGNIKNRFLPRIGRCVLSRIDVDYSPGGQWQTYSDGMPVEIRLRLDFTEVELVTKQKIQSEGF